ncbi:MAG: hypothetical protein AAFQ63_22415 [Cyanobacteria bacterium J06621_11]
MSSINRKKHTHVIFRYFNAADADPAGQLGEDHSPETCTQLAMLS